MLKRRQVSVIDKSQCEHVAQTLTSVVEFFEPFLLGSSRPIGPSVFLPDIVIYLNCLIHVKPISPPSWKSEVSSGQTIFDVVVQANVEPISNG